MTTDTYGKFKVGIYDICLKMFLEGKNKYRKGFAKEWIKLDEMIRKERYRIMNREYRIALRDILDLFEYEGMTLEEAKNNIEQKLKELKGA